MAIVRFPTPLVLGTLIMAMGLANGCQVSNPVTTPPVAERRIVRTVHYGDVRIDPYAWLRDRDDPAVMAHLRRENAYAESVLARLQPLRDQLHAEMIARLPRVDVAPAVQFGPWEYYERFVASSDYAVWCRRPVDGGPEEVLVDGNALAGGHSYYAIPMHRICPKHCSLAYIEEFDGDDVGRICIRRVDDADASAMEIIEDVWVNSLAWNANGDVLYYVRTDATQRPASVWRHRIGTDPAEDELLADEPDGRYAADVTRARSGDFVFLHFFADDTSMVFAVDATSPDAAPRLVVPKVEGVSVKQIDHRRGADGGWFYAIDDRDGARSGRLVRRAVHAAADDAWDIVEPESDDNVLMHLAVLRDWLVLEERRNGYRVVRVRRHDGTDDHVIDVCPRPGWTTIELGPDYAPATIRIETSAPLEERTQYDYDPVHRTAERIYQRQTAFDGSQFRTETLSGIASDGTRIPVTVVMPREIPRDGSAPAVLTGYGATGTPMEPGFYPTRTYASLLERGCIVAIAHVRGGGFYGPRWHDQGKRERKLVTYTDFVACADALFDAGLTSPGRLALHGGSAGGLLVTAAINLRPDMARVVVAEVPFVDCLNSMLDATIPGTTLDYPELGNPAVEEWSYRVIRSFAPYENIGAHDYPDVFAIGGINDVRVVYWEPAKYVARLRARRRDKDGLTLLRMYLEAGHGGASGRRDALRERADVQAFIMDRLGVRSER